MLQAKLFYSLSLVYLYPYSQGPEPPGSVFEKGFERASFSFVFTLFVFFALIYAVYFLAVLTGKPVPRDPVDMARPKGFRTLMLGLAVLLTPLIVLIFLPVEKMNERLVLAVTYIFEIFIGVALWLILDVFYQMRRKPQ